MHVQCASGLPNFLRWPYALVLEAEQSVEKGAGVVGLLPQFLKVQFQAEPFALLLIQVARTTISTNLLTPRRHIQISGIPGEKVVQLSLRCKHSV